MMATLLTRLTVNSLQSIKCFKEIFYKQRDAQDSTIRCADYQANIHKNSCHYLLPQ